jgi:hypothetical protein
LGNALTGGHPDETISSRIGKKLAKNQATWYQRLLGRFLDFVDPGHTAWSIEVDEGEKIDDQILKDYFERVKPRR